MRSKFFLSLKISEFLKECSKRVSKEFCLRTELEINHETILMNAFKRLSKGQRMSEKVDVSRLIWWWFIRKKCQLWENTFTDSSYQFHRTVSRSSRRWELEKKMDYGELMVLMTRQNVYAFEDIIVTVLAKPTKPRNSPRTSPTIIIYLKKILKAKTNTFQRVSSKFINFIDFSRQTNKK
jgi:hypothetical protein